MASLVRPSMLRQVCPSMSSGLSLTLRTFNAPSVIQSQRSRTPTIVTQLPFFRPQYFRSNPAAFSRIAAFHVSSRKSILPALPQHIEGTVNDAAPVIPANPTHGSYHWTFERILSATLIPLTVAPFAAGSLNPIMDATLCAAILIHSHIGFESIIIDYIPRKRLPRTRVFFWWGLRAATLAVAVGLYEFETNDIGLTEAIKRIWTA